MLQGGLFITFEGTEGSGKSTQQNLFSKYLIEHDREVVVTKEPGGTALGSHIREILLQKSAVNISERAELLLFCADRAQHVQEVIKPALAEGKIVLCDRYIDSTSAYQIGGRGISEELVRELVCISSQDLLPDLTLLFTIDLDLGLQRATKLGPDRFESEQIEFHSRVQNYYLELAKREKKRIHTIDVGEQAIMEVHQKVIKFWEDYRT